jgi:hypothetical protein
MTTTVAIVAGVAAAAAAVWPYLSALRQDPPLSPKCRAAWVNRLFLLVEAAEQAGESQVAANARDLISSLVVPQEAPKRVR